MKQLQFPPTLYYFVEVATNLNILKYLYSCPSCYTIIIIWRNDYRKSLNRYFDKTVQTYFGGELQRIVQFFITC
jgi:hypothetical protein